MKQNEGLDYAVPKADVPLDWTVICLYLPPYRTSHKVKWPKSQIVVGITGDSSPGGLCWSSTDLVTCGPDEPRWTLNQTLVQGWMPDYCFYWTTRSSAIQRWQRWQWCSSSTRRWLSRSRGRFGLESGIEHWQSGTDARQYTAKFLRYVLWLNTIRWTKNDSSKTSAVHCKVSAIRAVVKYYPMDQKWLLENLYEDSGFYGKGLHQEQNANSFWSVMMKISLT